MKLVMLDGYATNPGDLSWEELERFGTLTVYDRTPLDDEAEIIRRVGDADVIITNKTPLSRKVFETCPNVKFVTVLATGFNIVDTAAAREHGVAVSNVPSYGTESVSQFAFALLLEICHHVAHHSEAVHAGRWGTSPDWCFWDYPLIELAGKTMGIIGFGRIGQQTGKIARAFGMEVLAYSRSRREGAEAFGTYVDLDTLLARSDVIALHCPLSPETAGIINKDTIAKMKDGVILINNSRGPLVVEQDLADALNTGKIAAAGLDVLSEEPVRAENPLLTAKNCFITPHISWAPKEARQRIIDTTRDNIRAFAEGAPIHVVN